MLWFGWAAILYQGGCLASRLICTLLSSTLSFTQGSEWHLGPPGYKFLQPCKDCWTFWLHWPKTPKQEPSAGAPSMLKGLGQRFFRPLGSLGCAKHKAHRPPPRAAAAGSHSGCPVKRGNPWQGLSPASWNEFPAPQSRAPAIAEGIPTAVRFLVAVRQLAQVALRYRMCPGRAGLALTAGRLRQSQAHTVLPGAKCLPLPWENKAGIFLWNGTE